MVTFSLDSERFRKLLLSFPEKAVTILYDRYYNSLVRVAWSLTQDIRVSEDIVQEAFVHLWEHHKRLGEPHEQSIQYYLVRVIRNKSISFFRRQATNQLRTRRYVEGAGFLTQYRPADEEIIQKEVDREIRQVIDTFPARERECLLLRLDDEMTVEQIAVRMNVSRKAVERSMTSANKRLRLYWLKRL